MSAKTNLNEQQKEAIDAIKKFIAHPAANTFVLKGYAGTGKTFLMQHLAKWLKEKKHKFIMLASTGRAATVLRGKTGFPAKTVHGELYRFSKIDGADGAQSENTPVDQYGQMTLQFSLRATDEEKVIYIVDEASMLSSELQLDGSTTQFGSGYLLNDFFQTAGNNKIIFVGDPGQLPPVGQAFSPALDMDWLAAQQRIAVYATLSKIERNDAGNDILVLAANIRNMAAVTPQPNYPKLPARYLNNVTIVASDSDLFKRYLQQHQAKGVNGAIAVARSNKMVNIINRAFRRDRYGGIDLPLQADDVLLVIQNNPAKPLTNGDFVVVKAIGEVFTHINLYFQSVTIHAINSDDEFTMYIALDILYTEKTAYSPEQAKALMVDFDKRMKRKEIATNSEEYINEMRTDPYLNALKAKYGYAATCHKAQGGEWDEVFLFLEKSMYACDRAELYRWWYTAVTRAKKQLYLSQNWWITPSAPLPDMQPE